MLNKIDKRWFILVGVIIVVVVLNMVMWKSSDEAMDEIKVFEEPDKSLIEDVKEEEWEDFKDKNVKLQLPSKFLQEKSPTGTYWFEPETMNIVAVYESFDRIAGYTLRQQVEHDILVAHDCENFSKEKDILEYKGCVYLETRFSYKAWQKGNTLLVLSFNELYVTEEDLESIIKNIK
jgi:hypothetical protein